MFLQHTFLPGQNYHSCHPTCCLSIARGKVGTQAQTHSTTNAPDKAWGNLHRSGMTAFCLLLLCSFCIVCSSVDGFRRIWFCFLVYFTCNTLIAENEAHLCCYFVYIDSSKRRSKRHQIDIIWSTARTIRLLCHIEWLCMLSLEQLFHSDIAVLVFKFLWTMVLPTEPAQI